MRFTCILMALLLCAACAQTSNSQRADPEYRRVDYYQSVYLPMSQACDRAGGYMMFEGASRYNSRDEDLSYSDMRKAVLRGCLGT